MPNYIDTSGLVQGQQADADDVKTPLEALDAAVHDIAVGDDPIAPQLTIAEFIPQTAPAANSQLQVYAKSDGKLYAKAPTPDGTEYDLTQQGGGSGGDLVRLLEGTLASDAASVSISGWPIGPYKKLIFEWLQVRTNKAGKRSYFMMRFNGDSGNNYMYINGSGARANLDHIRTNIAGNTLNTNEFTRLKFEISFPSGSRWKTVHKLQGLADFVEGFSTSVWKNTSPITQIEFAPVVGQGTAILADSAYALYGVL